MGDPAGIGPEITAKSWAALRGDPSSAFAVIAPQALIAKALENIGAPPPEIITDVSQAPHVFAGHLPVINIEGHIPDTGKPSPDAAPAITKSIKMAVDFALTGLADGVVTNPIAKDILYAAGFSHPGHTEYLGELAQNHPPPYARGPVMMLSGGGLKVALATVHLSLKDAAAALNRSAILKNARILHAALIYDFGIQSPRIAMTGLNPHAGEGGALGTEEIDIINPAAETLRGEGINITYAQPADTLFHAEAREGYDAVLAMYHDQGLIPVKTLDFHGGVNITLGLPLVRTSPDHGTAFGIAGQSIARPDSLIAAIKTARHISSQRAMSAHG